MNCCLRLTIKVYKIGFWVYRWIFPYEYNPVPIHHVSASSLPWLFVGIELNNGKIIDKTDEAQQLVDNNVPVNPTTISKDVNIDEVKRYFYLNTMTLKEEEIPANGITINDS